MCVCCLVSLYGALFAQLESGPEPVLTIGDFNSSLSLTSTLHYMAVLYIALTGQGDAHNTGLYLYPVPSLKHYSSLFYSFYIKDPTQSDPRWKGRRYAGMSIILPKNLAGEISIAQLEEGFQSVVGQFHQFQDLLSLTFSANLLHMLEDHLIVSLDHVQHQIYYLSCFGQGQNIIYEEELLV